MASGIYPHQDDHRPSLAFRKAASKLGRWRFRTVLVCGIAYGSDESRILGSDRIYRRNGRPAANKVDS